jgi:hypothetical protein
MVIKVGNIVSHTGGAEWGVGKVLEVTASGVMIQFSDGKSRKIASSHVACIQPGDPDAYQPPPAPAAETKVARARRAPAKKR